MSFYVWPYNETDSQCVMLKVAPAEQIAMLDRTGEIKYFARDVDVVDRWAAEIAMLPREKSRAETPPYRNALNKRHGSN